MHTSLVQTFAILLMMGPALSADAEKRPVMIGDCIRFVRIQQTYDADDPTVVFSNDGRRFLTMVWHGDLETWSKALLPGRHHDHGEF